MKIINLNKHEIVVQLPDGTRKIFAPSGEVATVAQADETAPSIDEIPAVSIKYGAVQGLPPQRGGIMYLVNMLVLAQAKLQGRTDCIAPDSGATAIRYPKGATVNGRDMAGQIDAVVRFSV